MCPSITEISYDDNPVFLAIIRQTNESSQRRGNRGNKRCRHRMANFAAAYGMTKGEKQKANREIGPRKDIISVAERERQVLYSVPISHRENLEKLIKEYCGILLEKLSKGIPPSREVQQRIEIELGSKPPYRPPYRLGPAE